MGYASGDFAGYRGAVARMRAELGSLCGQGKILVAHHGDCDGMVGGGLLARWLAERSAGRVELKFASAAEFRKKDFSYFESESRDCSAGIFVEAQAMSTEYAALDAKFLNIDHHPHPPDTPIRRMLNPRSFGILPNPAISLVMYDLFSSELPPAAGWLAALGSIVDYCPDAAEELIARYDRELAHLDDLRDTFLAVQYSLPYTTDLARVVAEIPEPAEFLSREPFVSRREEYRRLIDEAMRAAMERGRLIIAETLAGEYRIASPLANRLQDRYDGRCIVVMERNPDGFRSSVRFRDSGVHLGRVLAEVAERLGEGDGSGHEAAGSARFPASKKGEFLAMLEERIG